ncbi:MAG TPA: alanine racemase [Candidatus Methanofastidiosa archaeon]|nr:alanine racemase [Candidatus Methanofastidiosa archaeon]
MATLRIDTDEIRSNISRLNRYLAERDIQWTLVSKVLCGHKRTLEKVLCCEEKDGLHSVGESRIGSLRTIKTIDPDIRTMYIKPPERRYVGHVVRYADYSLNTSMITIEALNREAREQGKIHNVIIMIELGELREGILRAEVEKFYEKVFHLQNIKVAGIGTNLGCMYGVEPTRDKLIQLCLYKQLLEHKYGERLGLVSGGSSITLPLIEDNKVPKDINHFRIGEAAFFGTSPLDNRRFMGLSESAFEFCSQIIELKEKDIIPDGVIGEASIGHTTEGNGDDSGTAKKAILDFGLLDVDHGDLKPKNSYMDFVGISSDMCVFSIDDDRSDLDTGDRVMFKPRYLAVAKLMLSKFIEKDVI